MGTTEALDPISIHALCEEGDRDLYRFIADFGVISIHALCEEGDIEGNKPEE